MPAPSPDCRIASHAIVLVAATICIGIAACLVGGIKWGVLGVSVGLAGTWVVFLIGLFALYHRQPRVTPDTAFTPADVHEVPRPTSHFPHGA